MARSGHHGVCATMRPGRLRRMALMCLASREHSCGVAVPADAGPLLRLRQHLDQESSFMLLEPGERDTSPEAPALDACIPPIDKMLSMRRLGLRL
jgi:hypothetical protein